MADKISFAHGELYIEQGSLIDVLEFSEVQQARSKIHSIGELWLLQFLQQNLEILRLRLV